MAEPKINLVHGQQCAGKTGHTTVALVTPFLHTVFLNIAFFCRLCYEITGNSIMIRETAGRVLCIIILLEKTFLLVCSSSMNITTS